MKVYDCWCTQVLTVWLPLGALLLLVLSEHIVLPRPGTPAYSLTYKPNVVFPKSYGFVEGDETLRDFGHNLMRPVFLESGVQLFELKGQFVERELLDLAYQDLYTYVYWYQYGVSLYHGNK